MRRRTAKNSKIRRDIEDTRSSFEALLSICIGIGTVFAMLAFSKMFGALGDWPPNSRIYDQEYADHVNEIANSELGKTDPALIELAKHEKRRNDTQSAESKEGLTKRLEGFRDLHAQEGVWRAGMVVAAMAILQTLIGLLGLYMLFKTLKATGEALEFTQDTLVEARKTTQQANLATDAANRTADAAENAERALILLDVDAVFCGRDMDEFGDEKKGAFKIKASAVNFGKSPALEVLATIEEGEFNHFNRHRFFNENIYDWSRSSVSAGVIPGGGGALPVTKLRELTYRTWTFGEGQQFLATWRFTQLFGDEPEYWQMPFFVTVVYPTRQDYARRRAAAMSMSQDFPNEEDLHRLHGDILGLHVSRNSLRRLTETEKQDYEQKWKNHSFST